MFNTHETAFLAGYVAAGYSETGTVGTWGGLQIPTVTIFMDGFAEGVAHYNEVNREQVEVVGWDKEAQSGQFVGGFSDTAAALRISDNMIQSGADVIMPVAGPPSAQDATAAQDAGDVAVIWVDTDGTVSAPEFSDVLLTSVMKGIAVAVEDVVTSAANGDFSAEPYVGTLENGGVDIAPYHEFDEELSDELKTGSRSCVSRSSTARGRVPGCLLVGREQRAHHDRGRSSFRSHGDAQQGVDADV